MISILRQKKGHVISSLPSVIKNKIGLAKFFKQPQAKRRQNKPPFVSIPQPDLDKMLSVLDQEFNGKCAYCEQIVINHNRSNIDHFRPKYAASGFYESDFSLDHYWQLAYDWRNMYLCCQSCNRYKTNWFPVRGPRAKLTDSYERVVKSEKNLLVDPCRDDPESVFAYNKSGKILPLATNAKTTIDILKLNRKDLLSKRAGKIETLRTMYAHASDSARSLRSSQSQNDSYEKYFTEFLSRLFLMESTTRKECVGVQRFFLKKWLLKDRILVEFLKEFDKSKRFADYISKIKKVRKQKQQIVPTTIKKTPGLKRFNIGSIEIENFKSIEKLNIVFPRAADTQESWLMLLGENGVGKSSFLQAVALTLMGNTYRKRLDVKANDLLRRGAKSGFVRINQADEKSLELTFSNKEIYASRSAPAAFVLAYGSTRLFPSKNNKPEITTGKVRAKNMFSQEVALFADNWLIDLYKKSKKNFDFAARALKQLLSVEFNDPGIHFSVRGRQVYLNYSDPGKGPDSLRSLSDGFKSIIAIACDMMQALMRGNLTMETARGIVLIDEIGTHLHPRWKMRVVNSLRSTFPRIQFICTTHDPLCLKGLRGGEVAVFSKNKAGQIYSITNLPDPAEFTADQLLSSRFFGLNSTIDEKLENQFNEYYGLLGKGGNINNKESQRLEKLKQELKNKQHLGLSLREELALTAADELLAEDLSKEESTPVPELKAETVKRLQAMWDKAEKV